MKDLKYTICRDMHGKPLVKLGSPLGNGQEILPSSLRNLAQALLRIADEAESSSMGKGYVSKDASTTY